MSNNIEKFEIEGEDSLYINDSEISNTDSNLRNIYPANVKVSRDVFSVFELKRKYEDRKTVILDPDFQRESVWTKKQKSELIESILMGIPLPVMYFAEDKHGNLQVIDGRQRLTALFEFLNNRFSISSSPILTYLKGKKFKDLEPKEQAKLEDYQLIVYIIKPQTPDRIKFDIFDRVNRGGTQLNKQEMRNALYQGKSTKLLRELSQTEEFLNATGRAVSPKRMKDRYLILRFIAFYLWKKGRLYEKNGKLVEYRSDIDEFLGKTMEILNESNDQFIEEIKYIFKKAMKNNYELLGEDGFRIPSKGKKRPINMALFESLGYLMSHDIVQKKKELTKEKVKSLFQDKEFLESITQRVDSSTSVKIRFSKMDNILRELMDDKKTIY